MEDHRARALQGEGKDLGPLQESHRRQVRLHEARSRRSPPGPVPQQRGAPRPKRRSRQPPAPGEEQHPRKDRQAAGHHQPVREQPRLLPQLQKHGRPPRRSRKQPQTRPRRNGTTPEEAQSVFGGPASGGESIDKKRNLHS